MVLRVSVGSKNPVKLNAVLAGFQMAFPDDVVVVDGHDVPSGVAAQPFGDEETKRGAVNRARAALDADESADFGVGLEGGCGDVEGPGGAAGVDCFAYMAVLRRRDGRWGVARTSTFPLPPRLVRLLRGTEPGQPKMELGDADDLVFGDVNSKQKGGTIAKLTKGAIDRTEYYLHAMHCALCPFRFDDAGLFDD